LALLMLAHLLGAAEMDHASIAQRIAAALKLTEGERVLIRFDPASFAGLVKPLEEAIRRKNAVPLRPLAASDPLEEQLLGDAAVFVRLPLGESARPLAAGEEAALIRWLGKGGARREIHFHWADGSRRPDGLPAPHPPEFDALYFKALDIDYRGLDAAHERAIALLRRGTVRIHTPAGTDLMFRIGMRPFNKQNGDASPERARAARVRVDRHIEFPAGALRIAPVEGTVAGHLVLPEARFGDTVAKRVVLQFDNGRLTAVRAEQGLEAVKAALAAGGDAAHSFREFALGFNPALAVRPGAPVVPYYGYGAGVVRVSLGDNEELGGEVRGGFVRWFFLTDATVHVDYHHVVKDGAFADESLMVK
jgi:hypothetical protein